MSHPHWIPPAVSDPANQDRARSWLIIPDLLSVIDMPTATFDHVNPAWTRVLGWDERDVTGQHYAQFVHPEDRAASEAAFRQVRDGEPILNFENRYRHKDGSYRWLSWAAVPEGSKLFSRALDVTVHKAAMRELAERTIEHEQIWQLSQDLLGVTDSSGRWISVNPAFSRIFGWDTEALLGRTSEWLEHPDDREQTRQEIRKLGKGDTTIKFENRFRAKDGSYRWLCWNAVPHGGRVFCVARDVTDEHG
ncbi:PAS domain-containing protein [Pseudoduganella lutea]|nr:PAS domain S-box protein [Pseudoduganella lutea]